MKDPGLRGAMSLLDDSFIFMNSALHRLIKKIRRKFQSFFFQPIRVFCLHQVNDVYNPQTCFECDWISLQDFKKTIEVMKADHSFVSMSEAYERLNHRRIRFRRFVVLTFDDGYKSSLPALLWLESQEIPYTLFLNSKYLDGHSISPHLYEHALTVDSGITESQLISNLYLTGDTLKSLSSRWVSLGSHGYEHIDATNCSKEEFTSQLQKCMEDLSAYPNAIPFHAYTWGRHSTETDSIVVSIGVVPVLVDGLKNVQADGFIHRELFPDLCDCLK